MTTKTNSSEAAPRILLRFVRPLPSIGNSYLSSTIAQHLNPPPAPQAKIETGSEQSDGATWTTDWARARLPAALEVYSALRVPEGHALVDLSESRVAFSTSVRLRMAANEIWKVSAQSVFYGH
jgi:hypothetical protein